jgi:hypothetical protein
MKIEQKVRAIMLSDELTDTEKLERLYALVPAEARRIKLRDIRKATPAQQMQLRAFVAVGQALVGLLDELIEKRKSEPPR